MTRAIFTATTLFALWLAADVILDPYWPNQAYEAEVAIQQLERK